MDWRPGAPWKANAPTSFGAITPPIVVSSHQCVLVDGNEKLAPRLALVFATVQPDLESRTISLACP
jgi:hypothetical protein